MTFVAGNKNLQKYSVINGDFFLKYETSMKCSLLLFYEKQKFGEMEFLLNLVLILTLILFSALYIYCGESLLFILYNWNYFG